MSLINQMLQELEQRKASASAQTHPELKPTAQPLQAVAAPRKSKLLQYAVLAALCAGGAYGMQWLSHPAMPQTKQTAHLPTASGVITEANAHINHPISPAINPQPMTESAQVTKQSDDTQSLSDSNLFSPSLDKSLDWSYQRGRVQVSDAGDQSNPSLEKVAKPSTANLQSQEKPVMVAAIELANTHNEVTDTPKLALVHDQPKAKNNPTPISEPKVNVNKTMSAEQQASHRYQQAIAYLQQGRVAEAQDQLKAAVEVYPKHDDARQTLVGLLVDNKRQEEAIQVLKAGLEQTPQNTRYAMTLARLQLDAGSVVEALNTLERHAVGAQLPQDYHALMAVLLQKTGQHGQAIEHYQQALHQGAALPAWYIGLGVSLQAEGRSQEAKLAYQQAQASQLSPELSLFVAQRLKQVQ